MKPVEDGGAAHDPDSAVPPPSARVRLEVDILANGLTTPQPFKTPFADAAVPTARTVLVVAEEPDVRRYVRECLRDLPNVRLLEAPTVYDGLVLGAHEPPHLVIVDAPQARILTTLHESRAIVLADDVARDVRPDASRVRVLLRPFTAEGLMAEVGRQLL